MRLACASQPPARVAAVVPAPWAKGAARVARTLRGWWVVVALAVAVGSPAEAFAHETAPGVLALKELGSGSVQLRWSPPSPDVEGLRLQLPDACSLGQAPLSTPLASQFVVPRVLDCGPGGLSGEVGLSPSPPASGRIAVSVEWLDGTESLYLSSGADAVVTLRGDSQVGSNGQVLADYVALGLEHVFLGPDHLLFLLGLILLVTGFKRLVATVSAFTLAHSVTLALATLGTVSVPSGPVEIGIALSILVLAVECTQGPQAITRRFPWLVAFGFGLLHGLGFASSLSDIGLPRHAVALSLLGFNLGVEFAQLAAGSVAFAVFQLARRRAQGQRRVEGAATWVLGVCSVFWLLQRTQGWLTDLGVLG